MRKRESKLLLTLTVIEDLLFLFDDYFSKDRRKGTNLDDWLNIGSKSTANYFVKKGVLNPDLTFKQRPKSILRLIKKPWDGYWRFVVFDIPQEEKVTRNLIRRRLKEWGFKFFQRSIWFSPLPLTPQLKQLDKQIDDNDYLSIIEGKMHRIEPKKIIKEKWQINIWKERALTWSQKIKKNTKLTGQDQNEFWNLIIDHPKVPLDLLPRNWPLKEVFKDFTNKKLKI